MSTIANRYYRRAVEQIRRGEIDDAAEGFRQAVEIAPMFVEARVAYAYALARTEPQHAANSIRAGLARPDVRPKQQLLLHRALGDVLLAVGPVGYREAEEAYLVAWRLGDRLGIPQLDLHDRLARLRAKTGRFSDALDELLAAARASRQAPSR